MKRMNWVRAAMMVGMCAATPAAALADGFVTPFLGINFGGDAGQTFEQAADDGSKLTWGVRAGGMKGGVIGAEIDFSRTNNFFGDYGALGDNSVTTLMPGIIIGIPVGGQSGLGIRPYVTGGIGLIRREIDVVGIDVVKSNKAGYSLGGGVMGFLGTHFGIQGDYRYFRTLNEDDIDGIPVSLGSFHYSRATIGAIFRF